MELGEYEGGAKAAGQPQAASLLHAIEQPMAADQPHTAGQQHATEQPHAAGQPQGSTATAAADVSHDEALGVLRERFGYGAFRPGQRELVDAILAGSDCVGVMPTGAGKSLCYQVPALVLHDANSHALTLVVSPLVSLMHDQVRALVDAGVPAAYLNSRLSPGQQAEVLRRARNGAYALMYVAPERLSDPRFLSFATGRPAEDGWESDLYAPPDLFGMELEPNTPPPIPLIAVDEAHCVSQWGQDFRPSYLAIADFIAQLPTRPTVAAFTATATPRVAADIVRLLRLREPFRLTTGFDRPNLHFGVEQLSDKRKVARVASYALEHPHDSGIVYCTTRKDTERVCALLVEAGVPATRYHAGLGHVEREANQRAFVNDDAPVMVATNAFGMGIDKSNVRYVIHFNMPGSVEAYYQEAGRAGRDGEPAECLLLWNDSDIATCRFFIEQESGNEALTPDEAAAVRMSQRRRLAAMTGYCMTTSCLRGTILHYFGDVMSAPDDVDASSRNGDDTQTGEGEADDSSDLGEAGDSGDLGEAANPARSSAPAENPRPAAELASSADGAAMHGFANGTAMHSFANGDGNCGNCSNCTGAVDAVDVTVTARSIMRCGHELRGRFGKGIVCDVLCGSKSAKIHEYGLDRARTYGIVDDSSSVVKEIIELLTAGEYLEISEGRYPLVGLGPRAREAATDEFRLYMKRIRKASAREGHAGVTGKKASGAKTAASAAPATASRQSALTTDAQRELFERLRQLRKRLADEEGVPPYIVFSDATLRAMCIELPADEDALLRVNGVGATKLARYGAAFLAEIAR